MTTTGQKYNISIDVISHLFNNPFAKNKLLHNISVDTSNIKSQWTASNVFYAFLLPPFFLRRDNGAVWLSLIATNLFVTQAEAQPKQIKSLQSLPHTNRRATHIFARALAVPKSAPRAYCIIFLWVTKSYLSSFYNRTFGFP